GDNSADPFIIEISADAGIRPAEVLAEITADNDYNAVDTFYLNISLMQMNFPLSMGENIEGAIGVLDVDYDNKDEIIFGTSDDNIYVCNEDGSILSGFPVSVGGDITGGIAVGQLDGPGALDMAICTRDGDIYFKTMNGANLPGFPVSAGGSYFSTPMILDMTPDFYHEVVFTSFGDGKIYAYKADGSLVTGFPYETSSRFYGSPAAGNLDGDDDLEIIAGALDGQIHAINNDGSTVSGFPVQLDGALWASPAIGDIDGDGSDEIIIGTQNSYIYALESDGSIISGFPVELSGQIKSDAALFDIDFDGAAEIFIGTNGEELYAIEGNGDIISGFPAALGGTVSSSPLIADVDGDNQYEIILAVTDGVIYGFENDGMPMTNFPIPVNGTLTSSTPALTDLDADGDIEIIVGLRQNHENLLAFDIKHSSGLAGVDWKMFGHDMTRQHRLHDYVTRAPEDKNSALPADFALCQNYPNPFNPATTIEYALPVDSDVELNIYNIMGQKVSTLVDGYQKAGYKSIKWNASEYSSGIYFYRMIAGDKNIVRKMLLIK
ncbi:MAG: T9SS type A sorting domain-containing protein, partial [candidate division Zixibacteria bacterium]|nr:T9SS type A sorting domain-containing protein [candidate division Zixibacteria bacterium]